jgi:DNA-binding SARP family transcriptional activator/pimeloyl-ACP methyl ester carboxylesterase
VEFLVLGPIEIRDGVRPIVVGAKQRGLLAALLAHANTVVSVDRLADILWGDEPPSDAARTLKNQVSRLRAVVDPGRRTGSAGTVLVARPPGYMMCVDAEQVDAQRFERLLAEGTRRGFEGEWVASAALLDEALGMWRGRAYAEFADDDFFRGEAVRLEELRGHAIDERVGAYLELGRHGDVIGDLESVTADDPFRERPRAQLMIALYRCGREADALRTYQHYRRAIGDELGIEPSTALRDLEDAIVHQKPELDWTQSSNRSGFPATTPRWRGGSVISEMPKIRYAKSSDGVHIAYQVAGEGPLDLVVVPGSVSHLQVAWEAPDYGHYFGRLASFARVIFFDKRGTGMSDPVSSDSLPGLDQRMDDVRAVLDAVGSEQAAVFGYSEGGQMAALFAATYPERTRALVLYGTYARLRAGPDYPAGVPDEELELFLGEIEAHWGEVTDALALYAAGAAQEPRFRDWLGRYAQNSASPATAVMLTRMNFEIDVRAALPAIRRPTLVLHRADDALIRVEQGQYLAEHIPGSKYVELPGEDHLVFVGDVDRLVDEIEQFLTGADAVAEPDRVLATLLYLSLVDPCRRAHELGDVHGRTTIRQHDEMMRGQFTKFRGREVKATGGFLVAFDGPARAVQCGLAAAEVAQRLGLDVRAGVHTGECEEHGDELAGIAVHVAKQIAAGAEPSQVLVSRTVTDLVAGSRLVFADCGDHDLEGVPGSWRLFAAGSDR